MAKLKTHSGGKKRFYKLKNLKYIAKHSGKNHNLFKKSKLKKYIISNTFRLKASNIKNLVYLI